MYLNHLTYEKQESILSLLIENDMNNIDFHKLMKSPLETINDCVCYNTINEYIALGNVLGVKTDSIILNVMIHKMKSANFNDYMCLISLLTSKSSKDIMLKELSPRFKFNNLISFYKSIGELQKVNEIKIKEILSHKEFQN